MHLDSTPISFMNLHHKKQCFAPLSSTLNLKGKQNLVFDFILMQAMCNTKTKQDKKEIWAGVESNLSILVYCEVLLARKWLWQDEKMRIRRCKVYFVVERRDKLLMPKLNLLVKHFGWIKCIAMKFGANIDYFYVCPTNAYAKNETFCLWIKYRIIVV